MKGKLLKEDSRKKETKLDLVHHQENQRKLQMIEKERRVHPDLVPDQTLEEEVLRDLLETALPHVIHQRR